VRPELIEISPSNPFMPMSGDVTFDPDPDEQEFAETVDLGVDEESELANVDMEEQSFASNLAKNLAPAQRRTLAQKLMEFYRVDIDSRKDWARLTSSALELLGIEKVDMSQLPFPGAASVQHPVIAEAVVQFNSNAIEEFYPATGPVKGKAAGTSDDEIEAQVERATDYMNYYLTVEDSGYYADSDQMLFYLPIAGSVFRKAWIDPRDGKPRARYVKAEDFVAPYYARDLENCDRYCHQYQMNGSEIRRGMWTGEFLLMDLPPPPMEAPDESTGRSMEDKSDRRTRSLHQDDRLYDILEYHIELALPDGTDAYAEEEEEQLPYIVVVDRTSGDILSIRRNWREQDISRKKRIWFAHYKFFPGLGFYGWGFLHVLGSLAQAVSGSVRALLDSALMATLQGGFRAKDGVKRAGSIAIEPGKWKDIDATFDELNKTFYTPPAKEPAPALFQLFQGLVQDARRFASITEVLVGTADNKAPVGTTLALIEQSMKLFTAIHKRIFNSAAQEFRMLAELFYEFGPDHYPYKMKGQEGEAFKDDFDDRVDFIPVADPNIISDVQRLAISQALLELMKSDPSLYPPEKRAEAHKAFIKALKVPDPEKYEPSIPRASYLDPLGENMLMMTERPVRAFPGQRHDLHRQVHKMMVEMAKNTLPPDQFEKLYQIWASHDREHQALDMMEKVSASMQQSMGMPMPPQDIYASGEDMDPEMEMALSIAAAQNLPPIPPPEPGSMADSQTQDAGPDKAAEQQRVTEAKNAESVASIERETAEFAAQKRREDAAHAEKMRQERVAFEAEQRRLDTAAAADILRKNTEAKVALQAKRAQTSLELGHKSRSALLDHAHATATSELQIDTAKQTAAAKKKAANGKGAKH